MKEEAIKLVEAEAAYQEAKKQMNDAGKACHKAAMEYLKKEPAKDAVLTYNNGQGWLISLREGWRTAKECHAFYVEVSELGLVE